VALSLPWIGALPPCPPATMQAESVHSCASYGASFRQHVVIRSMVSFGMLWAFPQNVDTAKLDEVHRKG
jgi:hypothetical protein